MKDSESIEMYLETIHLLTKEKGYTKAIDIARERNYTKASVSRAIKNLVEKDLIKVDDQNNITLTKKGLDKSKDIYKKHKVLTKMFLSFGVSYEIAEENACKIEHYITDELFKKIEERFEKL